MVDLKYYGVRFLQKVVLLSNFLQQKVIRDTKVELNGKENIIIFKLDRIGDAIWSVWMVKILKSQFPDLKFTVVCNEYNKFIFEENNELFGKIISLYEKPQGYVVKYLYNFGGYLSEPFVFLIKNWYLLKGLKAKKYDLVLNLTGRKCSFASKYLGLGSKGDVGGGLGVFNFVYKFPLIGHNEIGANKHVVDKWLDKFGIIDESRKLFGDLGEIDFDNVKKVVLFVGGKSINQFDKDFYEGIYEKLKSKGLQVDKLDDKILKPGEDGIISEYVLTKTENGFKVGNKSLKEFLGEYDLYVGIDGGVMHYVAQYIKTLTFFSSTNHLVAYPYNFRLTKLKKVGGFYLFFTVGGSHLLFTKNLGCAACFQVGCMLKKCGKSIDKGFEIIIDRLFS